MIRTFLQTFPAPTITIGLTGPDKTQGFYLILTSGTSHSLPDDMYVVSDQQIELLEEKGIPFELISQRGNES